MKHIILTIAIIWPVLTAGILNSTFPENGVCHSAIQLIEVQDTERYVYVGAEACAGKCHNNAGMGYQLEAWKNSRHSGSFESLASEKALAYASEAGITGKPWESLTCLVCHTTAAGYDKSSLGETYKMEDGVTCESCHKGEFRPKTFLPEERDCLKCHNNSIHKVLLFDFKEFCIKIAHHRPEVNK